MNSDKGAFLISPCPSFGNTLIPSINLLIANQIICILILIKYKHNDSDFNFHFVSFQNVQRGVFFNHQNFKKIFLLLIHIK